MYETISQSIRQSIRIAVAAFVTVATVSSCIDEDLSECGKDYAVDYTVRPSTSADNEIATQLTTATERQFGAELRSELSGVFTSSARDLDLFFYTDDQQLFQHDVHQMDAQYASYTIYLPIRRYQNLALASTAAEPVVDIVDAEGQTSVCMRQAALDTVPSHRVGLFSARLPMNIEDRNQQFHAFMYMQNCTACLVIDPGHVQVAGITGCVTGLATAFNANDSIYSYEHSVPVRANLMRARSGSNLMALYATGFPSPDALSTTSATGNADGQSLWQMKVYVHLANGTVTESILSVEQPLHAGQLRIIKGAIRQDGAIVPSTQDVGVSVKLDWKPGGNHEIEI